MALSQPYRCCCWNPLPPRLRCSLYEGRVPESALKHTFLLKHQSRASEAPRRGSEPPDFRLNALFVPRYIPMLLFSKDMLRSPVTSSSYKQLVSFFPLTIAASFRVRALRAHDCSRIVGARIVSYCVIPVYRNLLPVSYFLLAVYAR